MPVLLTIYDASLIFISAVLFSLIEIEIEGKHGWAEKLPTAKKALGHFTLYHVYMNSFVLATLSMIFIPRFTIACNTSTFSPWNAVCSFLFYTIAWFLLEDFLWFVLNPHYTMKKYQKKYIPWHKYWVTERMPLHNVIGLLVLCCLAFAEGSWILWLGLIVFGLWVSATLVSAPLYHTFYHKIRED